MGKVKISKKLIKLNEGGKLGYSFKKDKEGIQRVIDSLPYYVLLVDEDHNIVMANKATHEHLGISNNELVGHYCPKIIHNSDGPVPECPLEEAVEKNCSIELEFYNNTYKSWFQSSMYPVDLRTDEGKKIYFHTVQDITKRKESERNLQDTLEKLKTIIDGGIKALIKIVEKRDPYTGGHQERVGDLAYNIAKEMNLTGEQIEAVKIAGVVHDIGKIVVPIEILCKPGRISVHEFNIIKTHPESGYDILKDIDFPWPIADIILQHHERLNGTGYPNGLLDKDIRIEAKIISVADVVEAMTSHRPYRPALGIHKALEEIERNKGILYDKEVVEACIRLFKDKNYSIKI